MYVCTNELLQVSNSSESLVHPPVESDAQCLSKQWQGFNIQVMMRNIREIKLSGIRKATYLFTLSIASSMMVETLSIWSCDGLKHIIDIGDGKKNNSEYDVFPNLKVLSVSNCPQLEYMFGQHPLGGHDESFNNKKSCIHFQSLEKLSLVSLRNFIGIVCASKSVSTAWPSLKQLKLVGCSQLMNDSINDVTFSLDSRELMSTTSKKDIRGTQKHFHITLKTLYIHGSKLETIFCLNGHDQQISGQEVILRWEDLKLERLPQMVHICKGYKNSFTFQILQTLKIKGCDKLEAVFPTSIRRWLPELKWLEISECKELKQIVEDDDVISPSHPQPSFPKLGMIAIEQCHKLKRLFSASASSNDLPNNLEVLNIKQASELQELIGCEQGKGYEPKVELPKLKVLMLMDLSSSLCQGTELQTVRHRLVHNCPLLSLTSTAATPQEVKEGFDELELEHVDKGKLCNLVSTLGKFTVKGSKVENSIENSQIEENSITSTYSKLIEKPSSSSLQIPPHETHSHSTQDIVKEIVQEEAPIEIPENIEDIVNDSIQEEAMKMSLSANVEGTSLAKAIVTHRDEKMLPQDSQVVVAHAEYASSHSDALASQPQSYPHMFVDTQSMSGSCLTNQQKPLKEPESTIEIPEERDPMSESTSPYLKASNGDTESKSIQEGSSSEEAGIRTLSTSVEEGIRLDGGAANHLESNGSAHSIEAIVKNSVQEEATSEEATKEGASLADAVAANTEVRDENQNMLPQDFQLVLPHSATTSHSDDPLKSQLRSYPHGETRLNQTETRMNIEDLGVDDLINSILQRVEEDGEGQIVTTPSVSDVTLEHPSTKDNLVVKVLSDLEESLKMSLKDIATSEANTLRLLRALHFLSHLSAKDGALSDELKSTIDSMHKELPSILCSFKQAFATNDKFAALEAHENEVANSLVLKLSEAKSFMDEAQQKEVVLKERITRLEKEIKECEAGLSSIQKEKKKCIAETIGYKKKLENVRIEKSQMVEDQRNVRQEMFEVDYKWSALCSQFEYNRIAARYPS